MVVGGPFSSTKSGWKPSRGGGGEKKKKTLSFLLDVLSSLFEMAHLSGSSRGTVSTRTCRQKGLSRSLVY